MTQMKLIDKKGSFVGFLICFLSTSVLFAQQAHISGVLLDGATQQPLAFANVQIKGTTKGVMTDFDGNYKLTLPKGVCTVVFSNMGYDTKSLNLNITDAQQIRHNESLSETKEGVELESVLVKTTVKKASEKVLLAQQKGLVAIEESIGADKMARLAVSNASSATTKIVGVHQNQGTGDLVIRGLSDRYFVTTMNRLPIPSDDVDKKNIDLGLFSTQVIQKLSLSKTYGVANYGDQTGGGIDITSKSYGKKGWDFRFSLAGNQNNFQTDFRRTIVGEDAILGYYRAKNTLKKNMTAQGWDTKKAMFPLDFKVGIAKSHRWRFGNGKVLSLFAGIAYNKAHRYRKGLFKAYRSNVLRQSFTDTEVFNTTYLQTNLLNLEFKINNSHQIAFNNLIINKTVDNLFEQGRNKEGFVYDQDPKETEAFVRDQNVKSTFLSVQQVLGTHQFGEKHRLEWAVGYNYVNAGEPNRIRNEVNIDGDALQFAHVGDFQQRKSSQKIKENAYNGRVQYTWDWLAGDEKRMAKLNIGGNFHYRSRRFDALFLGVKANGVRNAGGIDAIGTTFTQANFDNGTLTLRERKPDIYNATLSIFAGYVRLDFKWHGLSGDVGVRYESDQIKVDWDVANYVGRIGKTTKNYQNLFPAINLKYDFSRKQLVRLSMSQTNTLPEFKELAPFEYVSPNGRVTKGNEALERSRNYNVDAKWSFFPSETEIISLTGFYKYIKSPINLAQMQGSSGYFQYDNTGEQASVYGAEFELRWDFIKRGTKPLWSFNGNATLMWTSQDLSKKHQFNGTTKTALQGATPLIINGNITYQTADERPLQLTLVANYTADKILVLGAPEDFNRSDVLYNDHIMGKGWTQLDFVAVKHFSKKLRLKLVVKNLLNPTLEQYQSIRDLSTRIKTNQTVSSYRQGIQASLGLNYQF